MFPGVNVHLLLSLQNLIDRLAELMRLDGEALLRASFRVLGIWILAWLGLRIVRLTASRIETSVDDGDESITTLREKRGRTISQLLRSVGRAVIVTIAVLLTFNVFINIAPILAGAGILGLAISFGAQSLVKDVIGGFFFLVENQFAVGDVIEAAGKGGAVEKMTLRVVVLRDLDGSLHVIPNGEIKVVSNKTRGWSRAVVDISVPHTEDLDRALAIVHDEAAKFSDDPGWSVQLDGPVEVLGVESITDNSVALRTLLKTQPGSQWSVGREFRRRLKNRFSRETIDSPYQQRRVEVTVRDSADIAGKVAAASGAAGS
jgi:moderate conductance mechanosensitive channel